MIVIISAMRITDIIMIIYEHGGLHPHTSPSSIIGCLRAEHTNDLKKSVALGQNCGTLLIPQVDSTPSLLPEGTWFTGQNAVETPRRR